jgi:hypothetical protein
MMSPCDRSVYTLGDAIRWVVDDDRVIVVDDTAPAAYVLHGREALIWRILTLSPNYRKLAGFLAAATDLTGPDAERVLHAVFERWTQLGVLSRITEADSG